jgi:UDP-N-acetylmuramyl pentapeptide phosphotransferase/UDP-N-acetylglucosamine-1-phosphate transferase
MSPVTAFIVVYLSIPTIVTVARTKHLFDEPGNRSAHLLSTPTLGGLAIFAGLLIASGLWIDSQSFKEYQYIVAAIIILFFVGIKDDILIIAPITKFSGQIVAALVLIIFANIRITYLHGFFGINEISYYWSIVISLLTILVIINGFNFIDGVDGLSASIGIITTSAFCYWFILVGEYQLGILSLSFIGALFAFFLFNVFGEKNKIFMGDTGSLIIGLILAILVIRFNELNIDKSKPYTLYPAPAVSFGVLIIPLFDLMRVMFIRILTKKPVSSPDKNHLHHQLLKLGLSHRMVTLIISSANLIFIYFVFYTSSFISIRRQLLLIFILALALSFIPAYLLSKKRKAEKSIQSNAEKNA